MNETSPVLVLENVHRSYPVSGGLLPVLSGIHLAIRPGTFTAIIGPSGSGKSTLLHLMGLLDAPDQGRVLLEGHDTSLLSDRARARLRNRKIGFIFQSYHLLPELSALENIMLPALYLGTPPEMARRTAMEWLDRVHLGARSSHKPSELSGGEQQRACLCRALINRPDLILADEPTGNLDSVNAREVEGLLETLTRENRSALVLVTHNQELAGRANSTVALLDGKVLHSGA